MIQHDADEGFAVFDLAGVDETHDLGEGRHADFNLLVFFGRGFAEGEVFGEEDVHGFGDEAGGGEVGDVFRPALCGIAGFFGQFALGGGDEFFIGLDPAGGELEEELVRSVAVLADEKDVGVFRVCAGVDGENNDRAVVTDDIAGGGDVAGFANGVVGDPKDLAAVDLFGVEDFGCAFELFLGFFDGAGAERDLFLGGGCI